MQTENKEIKPGDEQKAADIDTWMIQEAPSDVTFRQSLSDSSALMNVRKKRSSRRNNRKGFKSKKKGKNVQFFVTTDSEVKDVDEEMGTIDQIHTKSKEGDIIVTEEDERNEQDGEEIVGDENDVDNVGEEEDQGDDGEVGDKVTTNAGVKDVNEAMGRINKLRTKPKEGDIVTKEDEGNEQDGEEIVGDENDVDNVGEEGDQGDDEEVDDKVTTDAGVKNVDEAKGRINKLRTKSKEGDIVTKEDERNEQDGEEIVGDENDVDNVGEEGDHGDDGEVGDKVTTNAGVKDVDEAKGRINKLRTKPKKGDLVTKEDERNEQDGEEIVGNESEVDNVGEEGDQGDDGEVGDEVASTVPYHTTTTVPPTSARSEIDTILKNGLLGHVHVWAQEGDHHENDQVGVKGQKEGSKEGYDIKFRLEPEVIEHLKVMLSETGWTEWADWSPCSRSCGEDGHMTRERKCVKSDNPDILIKCPGQSLERQACPVIKKCKGGCDIFSLYISKPTQ